MVKVTDHMERHSVHSCDFLNLKLSGFQKLCFIIRNCNGCELHALFEDCDLVGVSSTIGSLPRITHTLRIFDHSGVF